MKFFSFKRKPMKVEELALALFHLWISEEQLSKMINRLSSNKFYPETDFVEDETMVFYFLALIIFAVDYTVFSFYEDHTIREKVRDAFYDEIENNFLNKFEHINQEVVALSDAYKYSDTNNPLFRLGLYFSGCITKSKQEYSDIGLFCSIQFGELVKATKEFLNSINDEFKLVFD